MLPLRHAPPLGRGDAWRNLRYNLHTAFYADCFLRHSPKSPSAIPPCKGGILTLTIMFTPRTTRTCILALQLPFYTIKARPSIATFCPWLRIAEPLASGTPTHLALRAPFPRLRKVCYRRQVRLERFTVTLAFSASQGGVGCNTALYRLPTNPHPNVCYIYIRFFQYRSKSTASR